MTPAEIGIVAIPIVVGFVLSILITWTDRPAALRTKTLVIASVLVLAASVSVALAVANLSEEPDEGRQDSPAAPSEGGGGTPTSDGITVAELAPDLVDRRVLSSDDSTGPSVLFSSQLDGGNRQRVTSDFGDSVEPVPGTTTFIVRWHGDGRHGALEIRELTGERVRALTEPPSDHEDSSPALAADAGMVYFVRSHVRDLGGGTSDTVDGWVMRVPLNGSGPATRVALDRRLYDVSVDDSGTVLAGRCDDPTHVGQACVRTDGQTRMRFVPGSEGTTMSDVQVSPDGTRVAYASFRESPYGGEQVYAYDIAHGRTTNLSQLAGHNEQPAWARRSARPCLLFSNDPTGTDPSVHLVCLTPEPRRTQVLPVGRHPRWLQL
ncbi:hypothetical protein AB0F59_31115 [Micromonospora lupini]|uniref:hypothetical protein n=1 Tax=Micromonospora lupini TaxID=285679 RepID=UPI0033F6204B